MSNTETQHSTDIREELERRGFISYGKRTLSKDRYLEGFSTDDGSIVTHSKGINVSVWTVQIGVQGQIQSFTQANNALNYIDRMCGKVDELKILEAKYRLLESKSRATEQLLKDKISALGQQMAKLENVMNKLKLI